MTERPYRVSIFSVNAAGESYNRYHTYWVTAAWRVLRHLRALQQQDALTGWQTTWGPVGLSWGWLVSRRNESVYAAAVRTLLEQAEPTREARRFASRRSIDT